MAELITTYISLGIAIASILFVVWDHFKDDRLLTKRIKNFYDTIEYLIFYYYQTKMAELRWIGNSTSKKLETEFSEYSKQYLYYKGRFQQNFEEYSKYLGLTIYAGNVYMNGSNYLLERTGNMLKFYANIKSTPKINRKAAFWENKSRKFQFEEDSINIIEEFLRTLRLYWKKNYYKPIFRKKLKKGIDFSSLIRSET